MNLRRGKSDSIGQTTSSTSSTYNTRGSTSATTSSHTIGSNNVTGATSTRSAFSFGTFTPSRIDAAAVSAIPAGGLSPRGTQELQSETDLPPNNQLQATGSAAPSSVVLEKQTGHPADSMVSRKRKGEVSHSQAYGLIRLVREYARQHPGILDSGEAQVTLPPTGHEQLPYDIEPPKSNWPIPRLPLADDWSDEPKAVQQCY
jgi:hypothetical protein